MPEHTFLEAHFDALFGGLLAVTSGVVVWVGTLYRRLAKSDMNEHRITVLEQQVKDALAKADADHAAIRSAMQDISDRLARIEGKLNQ